MLEKTVQYASRNNNISIPLLSIIYSSSFTNNIYNAWFH